MRTIFLALTLTLAFSFSQAEAAKIQNGFCVDEMNKELKALGLGSFDEAAPGVKRDSQDQYVMFTSGKGETPVTVNIQKYFNGSEQKLTVRVPSVLFGRYEEKEISLNDKCEVKSVGMVADGSSVHMDAKRCRAIMSAHRASVKRSGGNNLVQNSLKGEYPKHSWAKCDNVFSENVVQLCKDYESKFPALAKRDAGNEGGEENREGSSDAE